MVCFRSPSRLTPDGLRPAFSATLTTTALDRSSLRWFGTSPCRAIPEGHTSISGTAPHRLTRSSTSTPPLCSCHTVVGEPHDDHVAVSVPAPPLWAIRDSRVLRSTEFAVTWPVAPSEGVGLIGVVVGCGCRVKDRSGAARPTAHRWHCGHCVELRIDTDRTGDCDRRPGESHRAGRWSPAPDLGRWDHDVGVTVSGWVGADHRHAGGPHRRREEDQDDDDHAFTASARAWCSRIRHEGPLMLNTTARCMRRSRIAEATTASPKTSPQAGNPRLVVARVGWPFS